MRQESIESMEAKVSRSNMLWLRVNGYILELLKSERTDAEIVAELKRAAGRRKRNEPVSLENLRTAAQQIQRGEVVTVL